MSCPPTVSEFEVTSHQSPVQSGNGHQLPVATHQPRPWRFLAGAWGLGTGDSVSL